MIKWFTVCFHYSWRDWTVKKQVDGSRKCPLTLNNKRYEMIDALFRLG